MFIMKDHVEIIEVHSVKCERKRHCKKIAPWKYCVIEKNKI